MNKKIKGGLLAACLLLISFSGAAQDFNTGYFQNGYMYKYRLNPAFANDKGFLGIALGNIGVGLDGNTNLDSYFYKNPDPSSGSEYVSFRDESVSAERFENSLQSFNALHSNVNLDVLAFGFRVKESTYITVDLSVKSFASVGMPKDGLSFLKRGIGRSYDMGGMYGLTTNYAELGIGFSTDVNEKVRIGARIKGLGGIGFARVKARSLQMSSTGTVNAEAVMAASIPGLQSTAAGQQITLSSLELNYDNYKPRPSGFGAALDLGFSWDVTDNLALSAALLDLGGISWKDEFQATLPEGEYGYDPDMQEDTDDPVQEISDILPFVVEEVSNNFERLGMTARVGAEYRMPFYDKLSLGLLGTVKTAAYYSLAEGRLSLNLAPVPWFGLSASGAVGTYGSSFGAGLNIQAGPINLMLGSDHVITRIPFLHMDKADNSLRSTLLLGLNLQFGKRRRL